MGEFTDSPANTEYHLLVKGLVFADGAIDADQTSGTWYEQTWRDPYFIEGENLWHYERTTRQETFSGDLLE